MHDIKTIIDIGNGFCKGVLLSQEDGEYTVLAQDMVKTKGMRKGKILDVEEFALSINQLLESFAKKLGGDYVEEAIIGISHPQGYISRVSEQKRIMKTHVSHEDVQHLSEVLTEGTNIPNYEVTKIIPVQRILDERTKVKDPLGMDARKIELIADVFQLPKTFYANLYEAFDRLDIHVVDIVPNILGASEVSLDFDVKDLGVLLIDIGANQTSYVVYEEGFPQVYGIVPLGGEDVTKDISIGLQVDIQDAERIKKEKGVILLEKTTVEDESIDISFLSDIMLARYEEIFDIINNELIYLNKDGRLPGGVVLLGGGSKANNLGLLAKDVFKLATFKAQDHIMKLGDISQDPQFVSLIGDFVWSNKYQNRTKRGINFSFDFSALRGVGEFFKKLF